MVSIEPSTKGIIQNVQGSKKISLGFCRLTVHYYFCNVHIKSSIATYKVYNHLYNVTFFILINLCDNSSRYQVMDKTPGNKLLLGVLALHSLKPASKLCSNLPNQNTSISPQLPGTSTNNKEYRTYYVTSQTWLRLD